MKKDPVLIYRSQEVPALLRRIEARRGKKSDRVMRRALSIVAAVRRGGDQALLELTREQEGVPMTARRMKVGPRRLERAAGKADAGVMQELERTVFGIHACHAPADRMPREVARGGLTSGQRVLPLQSVGICLADDDSASPLAVLMCTVPARIAGVTRIAAAVPLAVFERRPMVAAALRLVKVHEVYLMSGAQAVAAFAYGTETIPRVDKIVGPGGAWAEAAKRAVCGDAGVELAAGPGELAVLAGIVADPRWIAADMLAQAESGEEAVAVCFTDSLPHAVLVQAELHRQLAALPGGGRARQALGDRGAIVVVEDYFEAVRWISELAPARLQIFSCIPESFLDLIRNVGVVFRGDDTPAALGEYSSGSNRFAPEGSRARFLSPLGVHSFQRRMNIVRCSPAELARAGKPAEILARAEGREACARSLGARRTRNEPSR